MARPVPKYRHQTPRFFHSPLSLKIGLFGGSFNPAHDGHIHVAVEAQRRLKLDQIWWLVSPQNPLKTASGMACLTERMAQATRIAAPYPFIHVLSPEAELPHNYTINTLKFMKKTMPKARFVWIMGADNLVQFSKWHRYREIIRLLPIAVIDRPSYAYQAIAAGRRNFRRRYRVTALRQALANRSRPGKGWSFIAGRKHSASASAIRQQQAQSAG